MKISYMMKRESFYKINEKTLMKFFPKSNEKSRLYIYPELNAIIRKRPAGEVKKYLYTEFHVKSAWYKRLLVWFYTRICLNTFGLLSSKRIDIDANISEDILIYPCNRKYRIFDFSKETVSVVVKYGFPNHCLKREIDFRVNNSDCEFISPIVEHSDFCYTEKIIKGVPLARISKNYDELKRDALKIWSDFAAKTKKTVSSQEYAKTLSEQAEKLKQRIKKKDKKIDFELLEDVFEKLLGKLSKSGESVDVMLSHGDLQEGNIWIEDDTNKIYIIDWESVLERSAWYDNAVLYDGIRNGANFCKFCTTHSLEHVTVAAEEVIYRMDELCELPEDYGTDDFNNFIKKLSESIKNV
ncbi:MAG: phosphotransferase [Clostridia bacterium]|nr:phosphotransferase [Clostridia bacterium]